MREEKLEVLVTMQEYIEKLYDGIQTVVDCFNDRRDGQAFELTISVIDGLAWVFDAIRLTNDVHATPINLEEIKPILSELIEAQENNDTVLICDVLQYEIMPKIEEWYNTINSTLTENN